MNVSYLIFVLLLSLITHNVECDIIVTEDATIYSDIVSAQLIQVFL